MKQEYKKIKKQMILSIKNIIIEVKYAIYEIKNIMV